MSKTENVLSNFLNICILEIDQEAKIKKVIINTNKKFKPQKAKTIYDLFDPEEHSRIGRLLELKISYRKTLIKMNPKYNVKDFAEIEISLQEDKTYISINFFEDRREKELEIERKVEQFVRQAREDKLTGLFNRNGYWNKIKQILKGKDPDKELGIIMIDIDNLKKVNDTKGHLEGDETIKEVGNIILDSIRSRDTACRYGGDEFLIVVEEYTGRFSTAYGLARRLRKRIAKSKKTQITISMGVHVVKVGNFNKYLDNEQKLQKQWNIAIKIADDMAYKAKEKGKDRVECSESVKK